ncbi:crossover junction endodeoxyribonuclease RuvC [Thermoclostridium stercorarium subsp. stercorarium DSM 8532]|uniref:Crossover junction endodeoxyribonuclease RuvC n=3 Tax=Thermoclostridium stercorarium TaxID=1510 RepID=L7VNV5_THES1|nr:crossover junction endodeoxyribonuclease RuvC [Thermoclostridium stercorarium]AGC68467.1 crossover junction endodeoxyribonuclease RuvC [Thermoclostridium stercorarium subsp. stercorarium DSM 8532]AGI39485.1 RuvC [Thermoclostridium stercorarium subsp. stercorarium DSM 8532]ANW98832.1 crossover junction endodeoxyribonuclease RuvC [Thermoclostridium stercorarium subsp. thermolacticum DSM 2910]ANX01357.1 crossover junction endodeoxyribonuclease RuvC [Thermoclostridium stercorarium subsp. leptosp
MIILGIDPGFAITGYGIISYNGNRFGVLDYGVITTTAEIPHPQRLLLLEEKLLRVINEYKPEFVSVEELFFNNNAKTALQVGEGRGVALLCAARAGIPVYEYTPLQVKQGVTGYGRADKAQVQQMIKVLLGLPKIPKPDDAADALAVAICHAHTYRSISRVLNSGL